MSTVPEGSAARQATIADRNESTKSIDVDQALSLLCQAVDECGYTLEALEVAMDKDKAYIHRVLHGEKRLTLEFVTSLPADVATLFVKKQAQHHGLFVVSVPLGGQHQAFELLVSAFAGWLLAQQLPTRADRMARADLPTAMKRAGGVDVGT